MRIDIPCTIKLDVDLDAFRAAVAADLAAVARASARGAPLRQVNDRRAQDKAARVAAARAAVLDDLRVNPEATVSDMLVSLASQYGRNAVKGAIAEMLAEGVVELRGRGYVVAPEVSP